MVRWLMGGIVMLMFSMGLHASEFSKVATSEPELIQKGEEKNYCPICGMNLTQ